MGRGTASPGTSAVVRDLLGFRATLDEVEAGRDRTILTTDEPANRFLLSDEWAFLAGVICDYQMPAERAWATPYRLSQALGGWGVEFIAGRPKAVTAAFIGPPAIHRFPRQTASWVVDGARRVATSYRGEAGRIWLPHTPARTVRSRLAEFAGISQKKAAMAVEILYGQLGVPLAEMSGSDIAYDIHVRRVMLRTGLAADDDVRRMVEAARLHHPERPGALDLPMWEIGRRWCTKRAPDCVACPLAASCPKDVDAAAGVRGA
jgi:uncharacterized HhH-GPD family protein